MYQKNGFRMIGNTIQTRNSLKALPTVTPAVFFIISCAVIQMIKPTTSLSLSTTMQKGLMRLGFGKNRTREQLVLRYFDGVNKKDREQISSCFPKEGARIRDVCGVSSMEKYVSQDVLADRCMDFLAAHPDTKVDFHFPPTCGRGENSNWVFCHWYETGTWSGKSCGLEPQGTPLTVEGQTRFLVSDDMKITHFVVTRTYSDWEKELGSQID